MRSRNELAETPAAFAFADGAISIGLILICRDLNALEVVEVVVEVQYGFVAVKDQHHPGEVREITFNNSIFQLLSLFFISRFTRIPKHYPRQRINKLRWRMLSEIKPIPKLMFRWKYSKKWH